MRRERLAAGALGIAAVVASASPAASCRPFDEAVDPTAQAEGGADGGSDGALPDGASGVVVDSLRKAASVVAYASNGALHLRGFDGKAWSPPTAAASLPGAVPGAFVVPVLPGADEILVGVQWSDATHVVHEVVELTSGGTTSPVTSRVLPAGAGATRSLGVAVESTSRDVLVVYRGATALAYRTRSAAGWSAEAALPTSPDGARWVELYARPGSDEIILIASFADESLRANLWNGSQWSGFSKIGARAAAAKWQPFAGAYTQPSGTFVLVFSDANGTSLRWVSRTTGDLTAPADVLVDYPPGPMALAPAAVGDRVTVAFVEDFASCNLGSCNDLVSAVWAPGDAVWGAAPRDNDVGDSYDRPGTAPVFAGWGGGKPFVTYHKASKGLQWTARGASGWSTIAEAAFATPMATVKASFRGASLANGDALVLVEDVAGALWAKRFDGATWTDADEGAPLATGLAAPSFSVAAR